MAKDKEATKETGMVVVDDGESTGMVVESNAHDMLASLSGKDALAKLDTLSKAKPGDFERPTDDYWRPHLDESAPKVLQGIYLGSKRVGRYLRHVIAIKDSKTGKPMAIEVNGTHILTKSIKANGAPGKGVRVEYVGVGKTEAGNTILKLDVTWAR